MPSTSAATTTPKTATTSTTRPTPTASSTAARTARTTVHGAPYATAISSSASSSGRASTTSANRAVGRRADSTPDCSTSAVSSSPAATSAPRFGATAPSPTSAPTPRTTNPCPSMRGTFGTTTRATPSAWSATPMPRRPVCCSTERRSAKRNLTTTGPASSIGMFPIAPENCAPRGSMLKEKCCPTIRSSRRTCPVRCGSRPTNKCCRPTRRPYIFVSKWSMQRGVPCGSATTKSRAKSPGPRDCWGSKTRTTAT